MKHIDAICTQAVQHMDLLHCVRMTTVHHWARLFYTRSTSKTRQR